MTVFIGLMGTHSTGKSTFLESVKDTVIGLHRTVSIVSDKASDCRAVGFPILHDHTFESTLWIMSSVIRAELKCGQKADVVLVDRAVPDALAYLEAALEAQRRTIQPFERSYLYDLARHHASRYSLLLKTTLDESVKLGPDRDRDIEFRRLVDQKLDEIVEGFSLQVILLARGRDEEIREAIIGLVNQ